MAGTTGAAALGVRSVLRVPLFALVLLPLACCVTSNLCRDATAAKDSLTLWCNSSDVFGRLPSMQPRACEAVAARVVPKDDEGPDQTSFLQVSTLVNGGKPQATSGPNKAGQAVPKPQSLSAGPAALANQTSAAAAPAAKPDPSLGTTKAVLPAVPTHDGSQKVRTDTQVLVACTSVIMIVGLGWCIFKYPSSRSSPEVVARQSALRKALLCASFATCAWGMHVANKSLVITLNAPALVAAAQMIMTVVVTLLCGYGRLQGDWKAMQAFMPVGLIFGGMLICSFIALDELTLTMFTVLRNLAPLVALPFEMAMPPPSGPPAIDKAKALALLVILTAVLIFSSQEPHMSQKGLVAMICHLIFQVSERLSTQRLRSTSCRSLSTEVVFLINNICGLIMACAVALYRQEFAHAELGAWFGSWTTVLLVLSGTLGTGTMYFAVVVRDEIRPATFITVQNLSRIAVVIVGVSVFNDPFGQPAQVIGLTAVFAGALFYGRSQTDMVRPAAADSADARASTASKTAAAMAGADEAAGALPR